MRPAALADDYSGTTEVVVHAIDWLHGSGASLSAVCCIYATAPFVQADDLRRGFELLEAGKWQYVFSATTFAAPVFRSFQCNAAGGLEMFFPGHYQARSQDLPEALHDAAQFYWGRPQAWLSNLRVFGEQSTIVRIPRWRVQDIDTVEDWERAESIATYLGAHRASGDIASP
jgi:N-acylneuraminate cytidylyltransferase